MRRVIAGLFFFAILLSPSVATATGVCIGDPKKCTGGGGGGGGGGNTNPFANVQLSISNGGPGQGAQVESPSSGQQGGISNNGVNEGQTCVFTIHRDGPNNKTASVDWKTRDGTAVASTQTASPSIQGDYIPDDGTAFFKPEQRDAHVFIETLEDFHAEPEEYFFVILKNPVKAVIDDPKGKCKIFANSGGD